MKSVNYNHFKTGFMFCILTCSMLFVQGQELRSAEEAIALGLKNNKNIQALDKLIEANKILMQSTFELPKTDVVAEIGQFNSIKTDRAFELTQTIPFPKVFSTKKSVYRAKIDESALKKEAFINDYKLQVRLFYDQALFLENQIRELHYLDSLYARFIQVAEARFNAGKTKSVEMTTAQNKRGELTLAKQQATIDYQQAIQHLQALLYTNQVISVASSNTYQPLNLSYLIDEKLLDRHPSIKLLVQNIDIKTQAQALERASNLPDFTIDYLNQSIIGAQTVNGINRYFDVGKRFHAVSFGLSVPLTYGASKARVKALELEKESIKDDMDQQKIVLKQQIQAGIIQYQQRLKHLTYFQETALPNTRKLVDTAHQHYQQGEMDYMEYLYALQSTSDTHLSYLRSIQDLNNTVIHLYNLLNQ